MSLDECQGNVVATCPRARQYDLPFRTLHHQLPELELEIVRSVCVGL
jgi:hypothetical protein